MTATSPSTAAAPPTHDPSAATDPVLGATGRAADWAARGTTPGELAVVVLATVLALVRFHRLGEWGFWLDEAYSLADAYHGAGNYNPLGYALLRWTAEVLGGADEWTLRVLPAVAGCALVPLTWWCFRPLAGGRRAAAAALLVAVSSWQVYWSQTARFYTLVCVPALLGTGWLLRGLRAGRPAGALLGLVVVAVGTTLHLQAALLAGALCAGALFLQRCERTSAPLLRAQALRTVARTIAGAALLGAIAGGPWIYGVFARYRHVKAIAPLSSVVHLVQSTAFFLTPTLSVAALVGACVAWSRRRSEPGGAMLVVVLVSGAAAAAGAALFARGTAQYVFVFMPFVALLAVWPLGSRRHPLAPLADAPLARAAYVAVLVATLLAGTVLYFQVRHGERPRWREAYRYVQRERAPDDLVFGMQAPVGELTFDPAATDLRRPRALAWLDVHSVSLVERWARTPRPIWLVVRPDFLQEWPARERDELLAFLEHDCHLRRRFDVHLEGRDLDVEVYYRP